MAVPVKDRRKHYRGCRDNATTSYKLQQIRIQRATERREKEGRILVLYKIDFMSQKAQV